MAVPNASRNRIESKTVLEEGMERLFMAGGASIKTGLKKLRDRVTDASICPDIFKIICSNI
ncbi:hypothetical protein PTKU15_59400 [Paraburkholderia terrae]|nr:hypothetical protein PTKU15_59400 [Paraburkholderia terrae]